MDESVAEKLKAAVTPFINKHSGNIVLVVGSSECGKSTLLAEVLLPIFSFSNGFITTFQSPNYDSLPLQKMIVKSLKGVSDDKKAKMITDADKALTGGSGGSTHFKTEHLYQSKDWIFTRRGFDREYCKKIYGMRLELSKRYGGDADRIRDFRFCLALDDEIDVGGALIRQVCMTWRNRQISWVQLVQDITCFDCAVRNSAPILIFGYMNNPARRNFW